MVSFVALLNTKAILAKVRLPSDSRGWWLWGSKGVKLCPPFLIKYRGDSAQKRVMMRNKGSDSTKQELIWNRQARFPRP